tara:strand:+ start:2491 stop:2793 length:303 start_codon:yes stop_codon:yes gene_type:complete
MSEIKSDSVLVGWAEDPTFNDDGSLGMWKLKIKSTELKEMAEKYATSVSSNGEGGNVYITPFIAKSGKACIRVWDPNSEGAIEARAKKKEVAAVSDDLPF